MIFQIQIFSFSYFEKPDFTISYIPGRISILVCMKFDCIIMNPPYQKNLHLKVLAEAIKHLTDDGTCVNLSPVRWLQDPLAKYKKSCDLKRFEERVANKILECNVINSGEAEKLFNIGLPFNLGIYVCNNTIKQPFQPILRDEQKFVIKLYEKYKIATIDKNVVFSKPMNYAVVVGMMCGGSGNRLETSNGNWFGNAPFEKCCYHNDARLDNGETYLVNRTNSCWGNVKPRAEQTNIQFNTREEAYNFFNCCKTTFFRFIFKMIMVDVNVHPEFLPWMGNAINPRTGLKGYLGEWTDEDFYKYFELTDDEIKTIEDTMEKYEIRLHYNESAIWRKSKS